MPSPVAHSLAGYLIYSAVPKHVSHVELGKLLLYCLCTLLPDLDFIPGFLLGNPNKYHHGLSHSLGFATAFALLVSFTFYFFRSRSFLSGFMIFFSLYFSHVILDIFSQDTTSPYGVPALWPLTNTYYISPVPIFLDIQKDSVSETFITSLLTFHNLLAMVVEVVVFLPLLAFMSYIRRRRRRFT